MRLLSNNDVASIEDCHTPHTVTESRSVWSGRIVDMVEDHVVVVEGEEPVVRQYTRHPGAVAVVVMRGEEVNIATPLARRCGRFPRVCWTSRARTP